VALLNLLSETLLHPERKQAPKHEATCMQLLAVAVHDHHTQYVAVRMHDHITSINEPRIR
jgi:hypothetical protein